MGAVGLELPAGPSPLLEGTGSLDDIDDFLIDHHSRTVEHHSRLIRHRLEHQRRLLHHGDRLLDHDMIAGLSQHRSLTLSSGERLSLLLGLGQQPTLSKRHPPLLRHPGSGRRKRLPGNSSRTPPGTGTTLLGGEGLDVLGLLSRRLLDDRRLISLDGSRLRNARVLRLGEDGLPHIGV